MDRIIWLQQQVADRDRALAIAESRVRELEREAVTLQRERDAWRDALAKTPGCPECVPAEGRPIDGYTCPSCAEGDHHNCTRLTCSCLCDDGMTTAQGYLWKQRAQVAYDENMHLRAALEMVRAFIRDGRESGAVSCRCEGAKACDAHELLHEIREVLSA